MLLINVIDLKYQMSDWKYGNWKGDQKFRVSDKDEF